MKTDPRRRDAEVAAASVCLLPFVLLYLGLWAGVGFNAEQRAASDPLVHAALALAGPVAVPLLALATMGGWWLRSRPDRAELGRALRQGGIALALVALGMPVLRLLIGPSLPDFIPPEESARPGMLLGLGAGILEEALFRLIALPGLVWLGLRWAAPRLALPAAVLANGLLFAAAHEVGPGAGPFDPVYFLDRTLLPGVLMSALALRIGFPFIVTGHCAAHVALPLLFT